VGIHTSKAVSVTTMHHTPVLLESTLEYLALKPGATVIDGTLGDGGHAETMLRAIGANGHVLGIDASPQSLARARDRLSEFVNAITLVNGNFRDMESIAHSNEMQHADAILMDLGLASWQLDQPALGLSFQQIEPLDMRLDPTLPLSAADLLARLSVPELTTILEQYGDIRRGRALAARIVAAREQAPIRTTDALVAVIGSSSPKALAPVFQALRIAVNDELAALKDGLAQALRLLQPHGRIVVLSYHSGEDRIVKQVFRDASQAGIGTILTPKPLVASEEEIRRNSRSRSVKLRAFEVGKQ